MSYPHDYPYNTLSPDWDFIAQAATTLQQYGTSLLNVAADQNATRYWIQYGKVDVHILQVEVNTVQSQHQLFVHTLKTNMVGLTRLLTVLIRRHINGAKTI
eukprot:10320052-Ditylum_brightwellii.AAC.1